MNITYPIVLVQEEDKWWAYIPDLPGVYGLGNTVEEAKKDIASALELYIEDVREEGKPIPTSHVKKLDTDHIQIEVAA
jgi:predicted RNase H-like HicB family nuclease